MGLLTVIVGTEAFPALEVPEGCSLGKWKELLASGAHGHRVQGVAKLVCSIGRGDPSLTDAALLPAPPVKLLVDGPDLITSALREALVHWPRPAPQSARGIPLGRRVPLRRLRAPSSARSGPGGVPTPGRRGEEASGVLDGEAAANVLRFWFEELTPDDWFRQSHAIDDRVKNEFGSLHQRAAAGELAGWMSRADTCLALVVILDQFSRCIYGRCTPEGCAWDGMARSAANAALTRGDDQYWEPGPKRSALYLPFMHSEDLADKRWCVSLMREGLVPAAAAAAGTPAAGRQAALPKLTGATPRHGPASGIRRLSLSGGGGHNTGAGEAENPFDDGDDSSDDSDDETKARFAPRPGGPRGPFDAGAVTIGGPLRGGNARIPGGHARGNMGSSLLDDANATYSMQAAAEKVPHLPVVSLNHEHAKRFRLMKLDTQSQQAYMRDRNDVARVTRYQCLVCAVTHEFQLKKPIGAGVEQHCPHPH